MATKKFLKAVKEAEEHEHKKHDSGTHGGGEEGESWLISYADMMTLLCGFFIMLFSMAKLDEPQYEQVKKSVAEQFGGDYKSPTEELAKFVTQVLQEAGIEKETTVKSDPAGVSVAFNSTVFFDTLSADVRPQGRIVLDRLIESIASRQDMEMKKYRIVVEGHTDSRPVLSGVFPSNWELSGARAARVVRLFLDRGFQPDRLTAIGYADTRPELPARTPAGTWDEAALSKNRRVVLRILEPKVDFIPIPEAPGAESAAAAPATSTALPVEDAQAPAPEQAQAQPPTQAQAPTPAQAPAPGAPAAAQAAPATAAGMPAPAQPADAGRAPAAQAPAQPVAPTQPVAPAKVPGAATPAH